MTPSKNASWLLQENPRGTPSSKTWKLVEHDLLPLKDEEILVKSLYISVDPYIRTRLATAKLQKPTISESVAEVIDTKNSRYAVGDRIVIHLPWSRYSILTGKESGLKKLPSLASNLQPSAALGVLGMTGLTAYFGTKHILQIKAGETVVVSGAAGAVGSEVAQLARHLYGAGKVIGTAGGKEKCSYAKEHYGFDEVIDYKEFNTLEKIRTELKRIAPDGIDCYFDNVGGFVTHALWDLYKKNARVAICGQISYYNAVQLPMIKEWLGKITYKGVLIKGFVWSEYAFDSNGIPQVPVFYSEVTPLVAEGKIHFDEYIVNGFENVPTAFIEMLNGVNIGKTIVKV